jgi:hypothetical protein
VKVKHVFVVLIAIFLSSANAQGFFVGAQTQPLALGVHAGVNLESYGVKTSLSLEFSQFQLLYSLDLDGYYKFKLESNLVTYFGLGVGLRRVDAGRNIFDTHLLVGLELSISQQYSLFLEVRPIAVFFDPLTPPGAIGVTFGFNAQI